MDQGNRKVLVAAALVSAAAAAGAWGVALGALALYTVANLVERYLDR